MDCPLVKGAVVHYGAELSISFCLIEKSRGIGGFRVGDIPFGEGVLDEVAGSF